MKHKHNVASILSHFVFQNLYLMSFFECGGGSGSTIASYRRSI